MGSNRVSFAGEAQSSTVTGNMAKTPVATAQKGGSGREVQTAAEVSTHSTGTTAEEIRDTAPSKAGMLIDSEEAVEIQGIDSVEDGTVFLELTDGSIVTAEDIEPEDGAIKAAPAVIKRGIMDYDSDNHKGRRDIKWDVTFMAKVVINGKEGLEGVVVHNTGKNRPHSVRIMAPDGTTFVFTTIEKALRTSSVATNESSEQKRTVNAIDYKVTDNNETVKRNSVKY